jgi:fibro-slime domain-containing protein
MQQRVVVSVGVCVLLGMLAGCGADAPRHAGGQGNGSSSSGGSGGTQGASDAGAGSGSFGNGDGAMQAITGGSGAAQTDAAVGGTKVKDEHCGEITAIIRDFTPDTNPDFEINQGFDFNSLLMGGGTKNIVKPMLENGYPAYAPTGATACTTGPQQFYQWYVDTPNVNMRFEVPLPLTEDTPGHFVYDSTAFFPIDGKGFGDYMTYGHNYHFTTEIRTKFTYQGGEVLTFRGDDDVWIFVNGILAVDLGGLHSPLMGTVNMDQFATTNGLQKGMTYSMDIFHAERHTTGSNFHLETTIDCFTIVKPPPPPPPPPPPT